MSRLKHYAAPAMFLALGAAAPAPHAELELTVERVRNERGVLHLCVTRDTRHFPDCSGDSRALRRSVPASTRSVQFEDLSPGLYAVSIVHDENENGELDSFIGIPREGFGFSGNEAPRFGPPSFRQAAIELSAGSATYNVRMRYLL